MFSTKGYLFALLRLLDGLPGRQGRAINIINRFGREYADQIPPKHWSENSSGRARWTMMVQWQRQRGVQAGLIDSPYHGFWRLTEAGHQWLAEHPDATHLTDVEAVPSQRDQPGDRLGRVSVDEYKAFFSDIESSLRSTLPTDILGPDSEFRPQRNWMDLRVPLLRGGFYQLWLGREQHVISFEFASSKRRNNERLRAVAAHIEDLTSTLGYSIAAKPWGTTGRTHVALELSTAPLSDSLAKSYGALMRRFILETWPILGEIFDTGESRPRARTVAPAPAEGPMSRHHILFDSEIEMIRCFLRGATEQRPSDEKLCDWIQFCYTFELFEEGRDLFRLVSSDHVNPWYWERTKKLARICEMKARSYD